jgi:hypothetical protein
VLQSVRFAPCSCHANKQTRARLKDNKRPRHEGRPGPALPCGAAYRGTLEGAWYVSVSAHARAHAHVQSHTHARARVHARTHTHTHAHARMHTNKRTHAHAHAQTRARVCAPTHSRARAHKRGTCARARTNAHMRSHAESAHTRPQAEAGFRTEPRAHCTVPACCPCGRRSSRRPTRRAARI